MENWVVAAAAGAGHIANNLKGRMNNSGQRIPSDSSSSSASSNFVKPKSSSPFTKQLKDKKCPFRSIVHKKALVEDVSKERVPVSHADLSAETPSTTELNCQNPEKSGHYEDRNVISMSVNRLEFDRHGDRVSGNISESFVELSLQPSGGETGAPYGSVRKKSILRSRRINGQFIKPRNSLEICLMGDLYKEHAQIEEYRLRSDGSRIINRGSDDSLNLLKGIEEIKLQKEICSVDNETVFGVPQLPNIGSKMISRKIKIKTRKERGGRLNSSSKMISAKNSNSQGASDGTLLFSLGISIGMISSFLANKREVDKLNELLKQTENLVQDLQEELEMKDSLTVKELVVEDYESQHTYNDSYNSEALQTFFPDQNLDESIIYNDKEFNDQKAKEESSLQIEAELEAELERLEQNMKSSSFERKLTDLVELDPDFVPDIVDGELRPNLLTRKAGGQLHADQDVSGGSTAHSANYSVSPTELSLRLHQVLETRLEERIKELETELQNKQCFHYIESESVKSCSDFTNSESGSSTQEEQRIEEWPVVINLAGEGLDVYYEAYDEFAKMNEFEDGLHPFDQYLLPSDQDCHSFGKASTVSIHQKGGSDICTTSRDENGDGVDEMEKVLIEQILEKTRKGFPAVLNAQRELFLMDQNEH